MTKPLTVEEAAEELRTTPRWIKEWLAKNPVDENGVPFYIPMGRAKQYGDLYNELPKESAQRTLRFWRMRRQSPDMAA